MTGSGLRPQAYDWRLCAAEDADAFDIYRSSIADLYQIAGVDEDAPKVFTNEVRGFHLDKAVLTRCRSVSQTFVRSAPELRRSGIDHFMLVIDLKGAVNADYDGRSTTAQAGGVRFVDLGREFRTGMSDFDIVTLVTPRESVPQALLDHDLHGLALHGDDPAARLLVNHVTGLLELAGELSPHGRRAAVEASLSLALGIVNGALSLDGAQAAAGYRTVRRMAGEYISRNLTQPGLAPDAIAAAIGASRSTLYRSFEPVGGVSAYILARRLDACFDALLARRGRHPSIAEIAFRHGFTSDAHFSRAFRARFGIPPSEVGDIPLLADPPPSSGEGDNLAVLEWLRRL